MTPGQKTDIRKVLMRLEIVIGELQVHTDYLEKDEQLELYHPGFRNLVSAMNEYKRTLEKIQVNGASL